MPHKLCELDAFIAQWPKANIHAVVVVRNGKLVMERYFAGEDERWGDKLGRVTYGPEVKHDLRSISKSVTSLLVGIARGEGKFPALDSSVFDAFPDYADLRTPEKARITFRDLLDHVGRPGLGREPAVERSAQQRARDDHGGRSVPLHPLAAGRLPAGHGLRLLRRRHVAARRDAHQVHRSAACATMRATSSSARRLTDFEWLDAGVSGQLGAFGSLRLRPRDAAKLGRLLLTDGQWNGKQVLPAGWAAESIKPRINGEGLFFYGYQWWLGRSFRNGGELTWTAGVGSGRPAPLRRAVARPRGHDQCRPLPATGCRASSRSASSTASCCRR